MSRACLRLSPLPALGAAAMIALGAKADPLPQPGPQTLSVTVTPSFVSQYMFRGYRLGGPSFEPSIEGDAGDLAVGVWANFPIADAVPGQSDPEFDPYATYTWKLNPTFSLAPGLTVYTYPRGDVDEGMYRTTVEPNLALNANLGGVQLTPKLYYDAVSRSLTGELNATAAIPLRSIGSELDLLATLGGYRTDDAENAAATGEPETRAWGGYGLAGVSLPFQVSSASKVTLGYAYTGAFDARIKEGDRLAEPAEPAASRSVISFAIAVTF